MMALKTNPTAISSILLPNCGLIAKRLINKRPSNFAALSLNGLSSSRLHMQYRSQLAFPVSTTRLPPDLLNLVRRQYVTKKTEPIQATPPPTPSNLPQREQIERTFFRIVAFFWDSAYLTFSWLQRVLKTHVVDDPTVQHYWKRFHEKMDDSKKSI